MTKRFSAAIFLIITYMLLPACLHAEIVDRVVAVVNDNVITLSELKDRARNILARSGKQAGNATDQVLARLLPQLIDEQLVNDKIKSLGIRVSDKEIDWAIKRVCETNNLTLKELEARLRTQGTTMAEYRNNIKQQIQHTRLISAEVREKIVITDEKIDEYLKEHPRGSSFGGPVYVLQGIAVRPEKPGDPASMGEARKRAEEALASLRSGTPFENVARMYSDTYTPDNAGSLGSFSLAEMAPFVRDNVKDLKKGEFSNVVESPAGFHIFRVKDILTSDTSADQAYRGEIREILFREEINSRFQEWLKDLRSHSTIRILL